MNRKPALMVISVMLLCRWSLGDQELLARSTFQIVNSTTTYALVTVEIETAQRGDKTVTWTQSGLTHRIDENNQLHYFLKISNASYCTPIDGARVDAYAQTVSLNTCQTLLPDSTYHCASTQEPGPLNYSVFKQPRDFCPGDGDGY